MHTSWLAQLESHTEQKQTVPQTFIYQVYQALVHPLLLLGITILVR